MTDLKNKYVGKFIGPGKIVSIELSEQKTPIGSEIFSVQLRQGSSPSYDMLIPIKGLIAVVSEKATDANYMRDKRINMIMPEIINIIEEYDIPATQIVYLAQVLGGEIDNRINRAQSFHWHNDDSRYVPGYDPLNEISLLMAERVISSIPKKDGEGK